MVKYKKSQKLLAKLLETTGYVLTFTFLKRNSFQKDSKYKRILIIEPFGLGDCVYLEIIVRRILSAYSDIQFYIWCNKDWFPLFSFTDKITTIESNSLPYGKSRRFSFNSLKNVFKILFYLRKKKIDLGIDFRGDVRNQIMLRLANVKESIGYNQYIGSDLILGGYLLSHKVDYSVKQRLEQYEDVIKSCNQFKAINYTSVIYRGKSNYKYDIVINFGARWKYKLWKKNNWEILLKRLVNEFRILIVSAPNEVELFNELAAEIRNKVDHKITQSIEEINNTLLFSKSFIGIDSGVLHLAARIGMPVIGLYGPGNIEIWKPSTRYSIVVHKQQYFSCSPCRQVNCIFPDSNCMDAIRVEEVYETIIKLFNIIQNNDD